MPQAIPCPPNDFGGLVSPRSFPPVWAGGIATADSLAEVWGLLLALNAVYSVEHARDGQHISFGPDISARGAGPLAF